MPLIKGFQSTTIPKAFVLNSLAASIAIVIVVYVKDRHEIFIDEHKHSPKRSVELKSMVNTFIITYIATFLSFTILYYIFGYGGGQLTSIII